MEPDHFHAVSALLAHACIKGLVSQPLPPGPRPLPQHLHQAASGTSSNSITETNSKLLAAVPCITALGYKAVVAASADARPPWVTRGSVQQQSNVSSPPEDVAGSSLYNCMEYRFGPADGFGAFELYQKTVQSPVEGGRHKTSYIMALALSGRIDVSDTVLKSLVWLLANVCLAMEEVLSAKGPAQDSSADPRVMRVPQAAEGIMQQLLGDDSGMWELQLGLSAFPAAAAGEPAATAAAAADDDEAAAIQPTASRIAAAAAAAAEPEAQAVALPSASAPVFDVGVQAGVAQEDVEDGELHSDGQLEDGEIPATEGVHLSHLSHGGVPSGLHAGDVTMQGADANSAWHDADHAADPVALPAAAEIRPQQQQPAGNHIVKVQAMDEAVSRGALVVEPNQGPAEHAEPSPKPPGEFISKLR